MTALARDIQGVDAEAVIADAEVSAGHDGTAELVLSIRYENGAIGQVVVDADTGFDVMRACGAADIAGLVGRPWREISKGL